MLPRNDQQAPAGFLETSDKGLNLMPGVVKREVITHQFVRKQSRDEKDGYAKRPNDANRTADRTGCRH